MAYSILPSEIDFQDYSFDFEEYVRNEVGLDITHSAKKNGETGDNICRFFLKGHCSKGNNCQFRHVRTDPSKAVVCKHWLRGLCKKGDNCEFLHEYNLRKMPECWFYSKYGECNNGTECIYLHIDPESKIKDCPWYARGFCKHGPNCRHKHTRKVICLNYLTGWCPQGPNCPNGHPKYELPPPNWDDGQGARPITQDRSFADRDEKPRMEGETPTYRNVEDVTCFKIATNTDGAQTFSALKCQQKGHYANRCPQGRPHDMQM
ncbi:Cleavage and polyadenylation specificity factor subunit 4 [Mortierella alpina]|nr:Cleavage and polyadenylation specificity factor subunit 4 [Mortierella alpina]